MEYLKINIIMSRNLETLGQSTMTYAKHAQLNHLDLNSLQDGLKNEKDR